MERSVSRLWNAQARFRKALAAADFDAMEAASEVVITLMERAPADSAFRRACVKSLCSLHDQARAVFLKRFEAMDRVLARRGPAPLNNNLIARARRQGADSRAVAELDQRLPDPDALTGAFTEAGDPPDCA